MRNHIDDNLSSIFGCSDNDIVDSTRLETVIGLTAACSASCSKHINLWQKILTSIKSELENTTSSTESEKILTWVNVSIIYVTITSLRDRFR